MRILLISILAVLVSIEDMQKAEAHPLFETESKGNYLSLYFIPSPYGVDWSNPRSVLLSNVRNQFSFKPRKLGHVNVHLKCESETEELTGMYSPQMNSKTQILINGAGYGILWHSFPGALEEKELLQLELPNYISENRLSLVRLKISSSVCKKLKNYLSEYKSQNFQKSYGLFNRPRLKEGAGCSAFGVSFLDIANLLQQETKEWQVQLNISEALLGAPVRDEYIPVWRIYNTKSWAQENEPHKKILFWDPDKMHAWTLKNKNTEIAGVPGYYKDLSDIEADNSPIWLAEKTK
jgi:hypothetical protein